jgi:ribosomal protein S18 acetylase RimI-like enzyme
MSRGDGVTIRLASREDSAIVSNITDAAYSKWVPLIGRKPEPMTVNYVEMIAIHPIHILSFEGKPVAVLVLMHEDGQTLIWSVAVHPDYQGQGLGLRLLRLAEDEACDRGFKSIRLYTNSLFSENVALYRWFGYEETMREPFRGSTLVHMTKRLDRR